MKLGNSEMFPNNMSQTNVASSFSQGGIRPAETTRAHESDVVVRTSLEAQNIMRFSELMNN